MTDTGAVPRRVTFVVTVTVSRHLAGSVDNAARRHSQGHLTVTSRDIRLTDVITAYVNTRGSSGEVNELIVQYHLVIQLHITGS